MSTPRYPLITACLALLLGVPTSMAALGGLEATVYKDQQRLSATLSVAQQGLFSLYTLTNPDGVHIREYVSASGLVFAVAWDGPVLPDMEVILGSYFPIYLDSLRQKSRGVHVKQSSLVIESGGVMRAFIGKAYLPDQLPERVMPQDIQ